MSEKQDLIAKMIALQKKFIQRMRDDDADDDEAMRAHTAEGEKMAMRVVDLAHQEKDTSQ